MRKSLQMLVAVLGLALATRGAAAQRGGYQLVVNAANPVSSMSARDVSRMFKKEVTRWQDGSAATPVDQRADSPARAAFSKDVHGRSVSLIAEFWRQQIFSGRNVPPTEKLSDADVLEFIRSTPGAIGYVSASAQLPEGVKAVEVKKS